MSQCAMRTGRFPQCERKAIIRRANYRIADQMQDYRHQRLQKQGRQIV
jgi:hypothetical protein